MKVLKNFLAISLVVATISSSVFAAENTEISDEKTGQVLITITMTEDQGPEFIESMKFAIRQANESLKQEIALTDDKDKINFLLETIENTESINYDDIVIQQEDKSYQIEVPLRNESIAINGIEYQTDEEGYYNLDSTLEQSYENILENSEIELFNEGSKIGEVDLSSQDSIVNNDIRYIKTLEDLGEGIQRMGEGMKEAAGQVTIVTYPKKAVGKTYGAGVGKSKIFRNTNIVGCNKHDTNTNSINTAQFALQSSDCSMSVKLGLAYLAAGSPTSNYFMSANCVAEAISSDDGEGNAYCDGTLKNGKTNCSWFTGIKHTESFHTHEW